MATGKDLKSIAGSERVPLKNAKKIGVPDPNEVVEVTIVLRSKGFDEQIADIAAKPPKERRYMSRQELAAARAFDPDDLAKIEQFAHENSLTIVNMSPVSSSITLSGTVAALSEAFGTELAMYDSDFGKYRGRVGPVQVPAELADIIVAVMGLDNRRAMRPHLIRLERQIGVTRDASAGTMYTATELSTKYDFPAGADGSGECIAILEFGGGYRASDIKQYFSALNLAQPKIIPISAGRSNRPGNPDFDGEVVLDIEVAAGIAHGAKIVVYFAQCTDAGVQAALDKVMRDSTNNPKIVSISYGNYEGAWTLSNLQAINDQLKTLATVLGVTIFCSSGDDGSRDGALDDSVAHADFPPSSPYITGVGGTTLGPTSEIVWNTGPRDDQGNGATGGGISDIFAPPSFQAGTNVPPSANPGGKEGRGVPDVAADADPNTGYMVVFQGQQQSYGGTSASAPLWAALIALINQRLGKSVGFLNPLLSQLAAAGAFNDITEGNNGFLNIPCYFAGPGWDPCTGWGSPKGATLLQSLQKLLG